MYLNTERGNTNIDNQFKKGFSINLSKLKLPLIIGGVVLALIIIIMVIVIFANRTKYFITLEGEEKITIYQGTTYYELGYEGFDNKQNDLTSEVTVENNIDTNTVGTYEIIYRLKDTVKKRTITVIERGVGNTTIYLKGEEHLSLSVGSAYNEPGYIAIDSLDSDITNKVTVTNNVDTSKEGTYTVIYTVVNSSGVTTTKTRYVIVK